MISRSIRKILKSQPTIEGAGVHLKRACICHPETVILFEHAGERIQVTTADKPVRFLLVSGKPLNEPVAWYGPIVMNTKEELRIAFEEFEKGTFVK